MTTQSFSLKGDNPSSSPIIDLMESLGFEPRSPGPKPDGIVRYHTTP